MAINTLYQLMMEIDRHEDLDHHPIRKTEAYTEAVKALGWDIDWDKLAEERMERGD
jgi:hypothetical protein